MKKLNIEEVGVGCLVGVAWAYFLGLWALLAVPLVAFLWAFAGAEGTSKNWRRIGVPLVICGLATAWCRSLIPLLGFAPFHFVLRLGYGIPDAGDEGSMLGRFWWKRLGDEEKAQFATRMTYGALIALALLPLAWINVWGWFFGLVVLTCMPWVVEIL